MFIDEAHIHHAPFRPPEHRADQRVRRRERSAHFIEMEYVSGEDVRRVEKTARAAGKRIPVGLVLRIIADAAAGLDFAHKARDSKGQLLNLVHRDVSPQNVLVGFDGWREAHRLRSGQSGGPGPAHRDGHFEGQVPLHVARAG